MSKYTYKNLQNFEIRLTNKLLSFINNIDDIDSIYEELNFGNVNFEDESNRTSFNIWISIDYIGKDGKTFIEKFLENPSSPLSQMERLALIEKSKTNLSLFEIVNIKEEMVFVKDILENQIHTLWEPDFAHIINVGEFIFGRVGKVLDSYIFIGDINYLPASAKSCFLEDVFLDFNNLRLKNPQLTIKQYLKSNGLNLYQFYMNCIIDSLEMDENISSSFYDELDDFESYLQMTTSNFMVKRHMANLFSFFDYYLSDEGLTLYELENMDFHDFFKTAIIDGFINNQEDLNLSISTLKKYSKFLSLKDSKYKPVYQELLNISQNRFFYMSKLTNTRSPFKVNKLFSNHLTDFLNDTALNLLMDLDRFILYAMDRPLELTTKNKYIKRKHLIELIYILDKEQEIVKKAPNQQDFPLIHLFYNISLHLGLFKIEGNYFILTKKGTYFLRLTDEEKYSLIFDYIWSHKFIKDVLDLRTNILIHDFKLNLSNLILNLNRNFNYEFEATLSAFKIIPKEFIAYYEYLNLLGIINSGSYPYSFIRVSQLGQEVFKALGHSDSPINGPKVISLDAFKSSK